MADVAGHPGSPESTRRVVLIDNNQVRGAFINMGRKIDGFYEELLDQKLVEAVNNDFGKAVLKLPNQGIGEVREEVSIYFSAVAMQQISAIAKKYWITDPQALNELFQISRTNLIQGFRIGQNMSDKFKAS